jgi:hypothetical protein
VLLVAAAGLAAGALGLPHRRLTIARFHEQSVLAGTGASTYLAFHLRRVDAAIDPKARLRLDTAAAERREALREWNEIAHGVDVATAGTLEAEVRTYATALGSMGGAADEIENLHAELIQRAEPAVAVARGRLAEALEAYAVDPSEADAALDGDDPAAIEVMFGRQVALGRAARMQDSLQDAEAEDQKLGAQLDDTLHQLGFREGNIEARVGALEWAIRRATEREEARANARPRGAIEADLDRLTAEATRLRRPEWASVTASDAGPDVDALERRRDVLRALIASTPASSLDIDRLSDRHSALERRVAALESKVGSIHSESTVAQLADVHQYLLAHLTRAAHAGPRDESVPVILDEPFLRVPAERKWELLDMLRRLGEKTQLIYLTDDPFVTAWARRRAAAGLITLLEPISDVA